MADHACVVADGCAPRDVVECIIAHKLVRGKSVGSACHGSEECCPVIGAFGIDVFIPCVGAVHYKAECDSLKAAFASCINVERESEIRNHESGAAALHLALEVVV